MEKWLKRKKALRFAIFVGTFRDCVSSSAGPRGRLAFRKVGSLTDPRPPLAALLTPQGKAPKFLGAFPLGDFASASEEYAEQLNRAKEAWVRFATWCSEEHTGTMGSGKWKRAWKTPAITFPAPTLYLVETEVS